MKRVSGWGLTLVLTLCLAACSGAKQSAVEGKLVDWNGNPVAGVKITVSQVSPIKGYEQLEAVTRANRTFRMRGLFPSSQYVLKPWSDKWTCETAVRLDSAPQGETAILSSPTVIDQVFTKSEPVLVADIATGAVGRSVVEGKLVDGNGKGLAGARIIAVLTALETNVEAGVQALLPEVEGHDMKQETGTVYRSFMFASETSADGSFRFPNLLAASEYLLKPLSDKWTTETYLSVESPSHHGDVAVLPSPMTIDRAYSKNNGSLVVDLASGATRFTLSAEGVIGDSQTGLEWVVAEWDTDLKKHFIELMDAGLSWADATEQLNVGEPTLHGPELGLGADYNAAEQWVRACTVAGGGWRTPTRQELRALYQEDVGERNMDPAFKSTEWRVWAEPHDSSRAWRFDFQDGSEILGDRDRSTAWFFPDLAQVFGVRSHPPVPKSQTIAVPEPVVKPPSSASLKIGTVYQSFVSVPLARIQKGIVVQTLPPNGYFRVTRDQGDGWYQVIVSDGIKDYSRWLDGAIFNMQNIQECPK